ncbi:unnamed protein product [Gordionus sp. m RMFG-2023]
MNLPCPFLPDISKEFEHPSSSNFPIQEEKLESDSEKEFELEDDNLNTILKELDDEVMVKLRQDSMNQRLKKINKSKYIKCTSNKINIEDLTNNNSIKNTEFIAQVSRKINIVPVKAESLNLCSNKESCVTKQEELIESEIIPNNEHLENEIISANDINTFKFKFF